MTEEIDKLDLSILKSMQKNARKSFRDIARELGVSLNTVSSRVKRLEESGVIKGYSALIDPSRAGFDMTAIIGIQISKGKLMEVQKKIASDNHISAVYDVTGEWDSIIIARFTSRNDLNSFIKKILTTEYIERTLTQVVLNTVKETYQLPI
ncbi:MAG: Lrp/AsnC family transcriptional regulator [Thermoplasmata archaeon]|uniref:Lrp/AsnC family transcriptional regulator n=1 Tax=Candidatus Sysuiplasma superficiale TaxID=2823368 RepID=A0A8J8CDX4_9ARCH|nr:Lrp/AsnC family transcriptional regulator [Candidatus Sysuiplasma superficiale]MBX8644067.1 Lrp/AsnC family transcriptional regulator [Candidatus Sysuiplasma superficiale]MCL4346322.1 Lrp/AsnC family transcriptional regulator [Candidatus Thermoplasmatota archaeon]MCL5437449.1 Lrp/AsnC family transcriptional regulator [Candidatus Thermoplasmatota archaeon]